jgi:hypothetical protein
MLKTNINLRLENEMKNINYLTSIYFYQEL